jgi:hypothetical protein
VATWRLHEQVTAKWYKFAGLQLLRGDGQKTAAGVDDVETLEKPINCWPPLRSII